MKFTSGQPQAGSSLKTVLKKVKNHYNQNPFQIKNTLEARLEQLSTQNLPKIRNDLFGANPNRKFTD